MVRHRPAAVAATAAVLTAALSLSACGRGPDLQDWPEPPEPTLGLPNGSVLGSTDPAPPSNEDGGTPWGSLRPDEEDADRRIPDIVGRGRLIVGVSQSTNGLGYRDPVTGDMAGFEVDIAREIARDIFGDPAKVDFRYIESDTREDALRAGDVDIVVRTMTVTRARQADVEFSTPYLRTSPGLLVQRDSGITGLDDLADRTVCVTRGSTNARKAYAEVPHRQVLATLTWPDCLMAMQRGQADATFSDAAILSGLQAQDPNTELVSVPSDDTVDYAVATAPENLRDTAPLVRQVNSTLERIRDDGTWNRLYTRWLAPYLGPGSPPAAVYRDDRGSADLDRFRRKAQQASAAATTTAPPTSTTATTTTQAPETEDSSR
jgi:polar amino acid transport system substrate-binding protein